MKDFSQEIGRIYEQIRTKQRFILTSHINPDGDGLGSELALYHLLKLYDKEVHIVNASPVPATYRFMDPQGRLFLHYKDEDEKLILDADVIFVLDISEMHRLGAVGDVIDKSSAARICIDHHSANNFPADILLIDEKAVATGELITHIIKQSEFNITAEIAEALYISLLTDTGCFRFSNTNSRAHRLGAELLESGVDHQKVYQFLFENNSWEKTRLFASTISTLEQAAEGKIALMHITKDMLKQSGAAYGDIEGFAEFARGIKGVLITLLFVEQQNDNIKISFRSHKEIAVNKLASEFGGGGHKNASAAMLTQTSLIQAKKRVIQAAARYVG